MGNKSRIDFIEDFGKVGDSSERRALFSAFVSCLTPAEACQILDLELSQEPPKRRAVLRKIGRDLERDLEECHVALIAQIMAGIEKQAHTRQTFGYYLEYLYGFAPIAVQKQIIAFLLSSKYRSVRERGYRRLVQKEHWNNGDQAVIEAAWSTFRDERCAELIIDRFPASYLDKNFAELEQQAIGRAYKNLYLHLIPLDKGRLSLLARTDEITFAYILTKQGAKLGQKRATALYENNKFNDRIGLLIWCYGQMGLWKVLEKINREMDDVASYRLAKLFKSGTAK